MGTVILCELWRDMAGGSLAASECRSVVGSCVKINELCCSHKILGLANFGIMVYGQSSTSSSPSHSA